MAGVELKRVSKSFGALEVIHDVDLSIEDGELVVFVGPSGCGKSTLLRLICGLEPASGGDVLIGGKSMHGVNPARRGVAMVFQSYALYPHMTVGENMGFSLRMAGLTRREREQRVQHAAETLQLTELLHRKPKELSGGQRQRVAIGRAIVREPEVFLFDEPLSNLDAELRVQMRFELAKLHRALGATMIYVTHDQTEAMTLADRIVVMHAGVIEQVGTPMELYQAPRNRFVAGFIGSPRMNFLEGKITACDRQTVGVEVPGQQQGRLTFNVDNTGMKPGDPITIGVRPEHFALFDSGLPSLEVKVGFVEQFGGVSYSYAPEHPAGPLIIQTKEEMAMPRVGDRLRVSLQPARCHLFGSDSSAIQVHS